MVSIPPPGGGDRHLATVPPGVGGNRRPGGGDGHGGGEGRVPGLCEGVMFGGKVKG